MHRDAYQQYLTENNRDGSGKANSYLKALDYLSEMIQIEPLDYSDCIALWSVTSLDRLRSLRQRVLEEQKKGTNSIWRIDGIPTSYLENGYCSAALTQLIRFIPLHLHSEAILSILENHSGNESDLASKLNFEPEYAESDIELSSTEGKDQIRSTKARIGQHAFRRMILKIYQSRCCITGLDIPTLNRASHIIPWAANKQTRMDPRNGLCLSATYDVAFDKHLISLDDSYRLIISRDIHDHYTSSSVSEYFFRREGQRITPPHCYTPKIDYLESHRNKGNF